MVVHLRFPDQSASVRIDCVSRRPQVAEIRNVTAASFRPGDADRGANRAIRLETPIRAPGSCIERIYLPAGATHEQAAARNGRLGVCSAIPGEAEGPLQFEPGNIGGAQPGFGLITGIVSFSTPSVPIARSE